MMTRLRRSCAAVLTLGLALACAKDPVSNPSDRQVRPDPATGALADRGGSDADGSGSRFVAMLDDCDPRDPAWAPTGGCSLRNGRVTNAEFGSMLTTPLGLTTLVGHPAWRNEPSYVQIEPGQTVRVKNEGGRIHTFTQVANFGGGRVPPLNFALAPAPECASAQDIAPGETAEVAVLNLQTDAFGTHKFQGCIHPWMRAAIKTVAKDDRHD